MAWHTSASFRDDTRGFSTAFPQYWVCPIGMGPCWSGR